MRLIRCRAGTAEFWASWIRPENRSPRSIRPFGDWAPAVCRIRVRSRATPASRCRCASVDLLAPLQPGCTVFAGGANYGRHLAELGLDGARPRVFLKAASSMIGAQSPIRYPPVTDCLDYEVELVAVFGATAFDPDDPWAGVLGYAVGNDVSARDLQFAKSVTGMDIFSAKSLKATSPVGPWILTRDEVGDAKPDLMMTLTVNGEQRQHASTSEMVWDVAALLAYADSRAGVSCGDLLFTGSPAGIGHTTGRYLRPGDIVEAAIDGLGAQHNVVSARPMMAAREVGATARVDKSTMATLDDWDTTLAQPPSLRDRKRHHAEPTTMTETHDDYDSFTAAELDEKLWVPVQMPSPDGELVRCEEPRAKTTVGAGILEIRVDEFERKNDSSQALDNAKHVLVSTRQFPIPPTGDTMFSVEMHAERLNDGTYDFRNGFSAFNVIDIVETGSVFDHMATDRGTRAVREQLHVPGFIEAGEPFTWLVETPALDDLDFADYHDYAVVLNRAESRATWLVDDVTVFEALDVSIPASVQIGLGLMTLVPIKYGRSTSLHGQGVVARWRRLRIANDDPPD